MVPPKGKPADFYGYLIIIGTSAGTLKLIDLNRNRVIKSIMVMPKESNYSIQDRDTTIF